MERVKLVYSSVDKNEVELPFRLLVLGDFSLASAARSLETVQTVAITQKSFDSVLAAQSSRIKLRLKNHLTDHKNQALDIDIALRSLADFHPEALLQAVPEMRELLALKKRLSKFKQEGWRGLDPGQLTAPESELFKTLTKLKLEAIPELDIVIAEILERLDLQLNELMAQQEFRQLEASWKGLFLLTSSLKKGENCAIDLLNIDQQTLEDDFEHSISVFETVLYKKMYLEEFGQFGGNPYGALIVDYPIGKTAKHFALLKHLGQVAQLCHVPVIAQADPSFFGVSSFSELSRLRDLKSLLETHRRYSKWRSLRKSDEARYLGLTLPGFVIRYPYDYRTDDLESLAFIEEAGPLWGSSVYAFAACLLESFAKHRLCLDIIGPLGGNVSFLENRKQAPAKAFEDYLQVKILVSEKLEEELTEAGFISLVFHKAEGKAIFHTACSIKQWQLPKTKKKQTGFDELLSSQLPYTFLVSRIAHYIKIIQRDKIGSWQNAKQIEEELNAWLRQYVSEMENPSQEVIAKRPLRFAHVSVTEESSTDWYDMNLQLIPHLKFMGSNFSLSLQGILDRRSFLRGA